MINGADIKIDGGYTIRECEFLQDVARISGSFHEPLHFMHSGELRSSDCS
jgi:hypothetical protein